MDYKNTYTTLKEFWDNAFKLSDEDKKQIISQEIKDDDYISLAPSPKLFDCVKSISKDTKFLDYGCGNGWASIIASIEKAKEVIGVDVSKNSIEYANILKDIFTKDANITFKSIDNDWLNHEESESYDSIYSSNVLDVIPTVIAIDIIKELARIAKKDANIIFSFNYYMDLNKAKERGFAVEEDNIYIDGVLRLVSKTDSEWTKILSKYFKIIKIDYFAWPGEEKETRRIFYLKKK